MSRFKDTLSALGHFWPSDKPENRWPGKVSMETFPRARLHCIGRAPGDGAPITGRLTLYGLTENNQSITMLEAAARSGGFAFNSQSATQRVVVTANYMLVGTDHYDGGRSVRRLSFASTVVEHVLRLWSRPDYKEVRHRRVGGSQFDSPVLHKQVASYVNLDRRIRIRVFRPTVPTTKIEPRSHWTMDFLELVTPRHALGILHQFRSLLALICGEVIDFWDVQLLHKVGADYSHSELYFADSVERPAKSEGFPISPILDIGHDRELFRRVMAHWLMEPPARRVGRGAFTAILLDKGNLRFSHLRELVTIIEMQAFSDGTAPLSKVQSAALRQALKSTLDKFAMNEQDSANWRETIEKRIDNINYHDAKILLKRFISELPPGLVSVPDTFHSDVVDFRNTLVHDMRRITSDDSNKLAFFVAKLKAIYAVSDAIALGGKPSEIRDGSPFLAAAKYITPNSFSGDDEGDSSQSK
jgi:hypothetical protein